MKYHTTGYTINEGKDPDGIKVFKEINTPVFSEFLKSRPIKEITFEDEKEILYRLKGDVFLKIKKGFKKTKKNTPDMYNLKSKVKKC